MKNHPDQGDTTSSKDGQKRDLQETPRLGSLTDQPSFTIVISASFSNEIRYSWMR